MKEEKNRMEKTIEDIINVLSNNVIVIEELAKDDKSYRESIEKYYDYIKQGFEHKELRTCPVHFRFFDRENEMIHTLQLRHFVTNMMFWEPIVRMEVYEVIDASYIVDCTRLSNRLIKDYIDEKIVLPFRTSIGNRKLNKVIHDMIFNLGRISTDFNIILGMSMNVETFIDMANKNEEFNQIIRTKIDDSMQPSEIESYLTARTERQMEILMEEDNFLKPILRSGTGIKSGQFKEFAVNAGLKPDLDGNTIPIAVNSNFVVGGLGNVTNYYIDSLGGRKSIIMNKTVMGRSGHFARMVMLLSSTIRLRSDEEDCGSVHPIKMTVRTKKHLQRLHGRYYREPHARQYKIMTGKETYLIGKDILLRSPITCASKHICKTCYGQLYYTNRDIESIGGFAGSKITEPLSQSILSSKHLLTTQSETIEFNEDFYKFFTINANEVMINPENDDLDKYSLVIIRENIQTIEEFDESEFNSFIDIFHVKDKKTGEMFEVSELQAKELYIAPEMKDLMAKPKGNKEVLEIDLAKVGDDDRIFVVEISNNELTKPLYNIMYLLNNKKRREEAGTFTIDQMAQRMLDLLIESKITSDSVHGELLIRPLIRSSSDVLKTPNFKKYDAIHEYDILTVEGSLQRHPSVLISLSFQDIGRQLVNPLTFRKRDTSFIDPFFQERP
jgi:hypothetical protein